MAAVSSTQEPLPVYVQDQVPQSALDALLTRIAAPLSAKHPDARVILECFMESQKAPAYNAPARTEPPQPIDRYPLDGRVQWVYLPRWSGPGAPAFRNGPRWGNPYMTRTDALTHVKQEIVNELFNAIKREDSEAIALLIQHNLVTANTRSEADGTPLLEAISTKSIPIVKQLLDFGADPNAFGVVRMPWLHLTPIPQLYDFHGPEARTPLMVAASVGSLPLIKLLFDPPYSANDALVAPDGQIALRLAADAGHRAIVEYLPARRAGGFLRFKKQHAHNISRMKTALRSIGAFIKCLIWDVPKFLVWSLPKHVVVMPVVRCGKWCWTNRKEFGPWCNHQLTEMPKRIARFGRAVKRAVRETGKGLWKFGTGTLPRWAKRSAIWLWKLVTERIPKAVLMALKWTWAGISSLGQAIWDIILRIASLLHTVLSAIVTFLRNVTLRDIWNAFCDALRAVFVTIPATLWSWMQKFGRVSYKIMETLLGGFGEVLWWIVVGLGYLVLYVPAKLWVILQSLGGSLAKVWYEIRVWISPKL